jgi:hypothetical protein
MTKDQLEARVIDLEHELTAALGALQSVKEILDSQETPAAERAGRAHAVATLQAINIDGFFRRQPTTVPAFLLEK